MRFRRRIGQNDFSIESNSCHLVRCHNDLRYTIARHHDFPVIVVVGSDDALVCGCVDFSTDTQQ